jgi:hypothetical protein
VWAATRQTLPWVAWSAGRGLTPAEVRSVEEAWAPLDDHVRAQGRRHFAQAEVVRRLAAEAEPEVVQVPEPGTVARQLYEYLVRDPTLEPTQVEVNSDLGRDPPARPDLLWSDPSPSSSHSDPRWEVDP